VDNTCPLIENYDRTRVCDITGFVLNEVRHAKDEYMEGIVATPSASHNRASAFQDINSEVLSVVALFLTSQRARLCRDQENAKQSARLAHHLHRQMKSFKLTSPGCVPNVCHLLAQAMRQEKYWRFIEAASEELVAQSAKHMKSKGVKVTSGARLQDLVCGMLYMLKTGLSFQSRVLLAAIPELDRCLPHENKIEGYFGVSSKVICMTENEVKLVFRESYQSPTTTQTALFKP
jgi:hypothetical protein